MNRLTALFLIVFFSFLVSFCSDDSQKTEFDCNKLCDKSKECEKIKESQLENCKTYCKKYEDNGYFEQAYMDAMGECLVKDKCEDIASCTSNIPDKCPPPPDVSKYAQTLCDKMIECKATIETKEDCVKKYGVAENYKCFTQKFMDDTTNCISKVNCATYLTDFMNCQNELLK